MKNLAGAEMVNIIFKCHVGIRSNRGDPVSNRVVKIYDQIVHRVNTIFTHLNMSHVLARQIGIRAWILFRHLVQAECGAKISEKTFVMIVVFAATGQLLHS